MRGWRSAMGRCMRSCALPPRRPRRRRLPGPCTPSSRHAHAQLCRACPVCVSRGALLEAATYCHHIPRKHLELAYFRTRVLSMFITDMTVKVWF